MFPLYSWFKASVYLKRCPRSPLHASFDKSIPGCVPKRLSIVLKAALRFLKCHSVTPTQPDIVPETPPLNGSDDTAPLHMPLAGCRGVENTLRPFKLLSVLSAPSNQKLWLPPPLRCHPEAFLSCLFPEISALI